MKKFLLMALLSVPASAFSYHMDVIEFSLKEDCTLGQYMQIVGDFNRWGEAHGYNARIAAPLQSDNLDSLYWMGNSENAATFGAAWDTWRDALTDPESEPSKLTARFGECAENMSRRGYDVY